MRQLRKGVCQGFREDIGLFSEQTRIHSHWLCQRLKSRAAALSRDSRACVVRDLIRQCQGTSVNRMLQSACFLSVSCTLFSGADLPSCVEIGICCVQDAL